MRKLLNVLYVTSPEAYLAKDGENVLVLVGEETKLRIPIHNLEGIVCYGYTGASPALMHLCTERNVGLSFHSESGRFLARVTGRVSGNVLLRRKQYRIADNSEESLQLAKSFIFGKIYNSRCVLQRFYVIMVKKAIFWIYKKELSFFRYSYRKSLTVAMLIYSAG